MNRSKIWIKNFIAGRKALFKNILIYSGSAIAVYEAIHQVLENTTIRSFLEKNSIIKRLILPCADNILFFLLIAVFIAFFSQLNYSSFSRRINGTSIDIEFQVKDILKCKGDLIIPCNNLFASEESVIGTRSIQYQLQKRNSTKKLDCFASVKEQIKKALQREEFASSVLPVKQRVLNGNEYNVYPYGMMLPISFSSDPTSQQYYYLSMSYISSEGVPHVDIDILKKSIDSMWDYICKNHIRDNTLVVPVMGTGAAGMTETTKQDIAKYILKAFAKNFKNSGLKKMILCIYPGDYVDNSINLDELRDYIGYLCEFPDF